MSTEYRHVELLTGDIRRRRWTTEQKLTTLSRVSNQARRYLRPLAAMAPNLLYRWCRAK